MTDPLAWLFALEQFGIKLGLENIELLLDSLGRPERTFTSVHVAGTNGKGSVTALVDAVLLAAGHRSARYTSPHLIDLNERFVVFGTPLQTGAVAAAADKMRRHVDRLRAQGALRVQPTFFEVTTAMAFDLFHAAGVDVAVIETGLGGRLDATNVLTPMVAVITSIAFDHEQHLGRTLRDIAAEKAGIIKRHIPLVVGELEEEAAEPIDRRADELGATVVRASEGVDLSVLRSEPHGGTTLRIRTPARDYGELTLALGGRHQIGNACVAIRILELLDANGIPVSVDAVRTGLAHVRWPGRLEHRRLADGREIILDAAHNPAGARALAVFLAETGGEKPPLVFAAMRDKDVRSMLRELSPSIGSLIVTRASTARSADPADLAREAAAIAPALPILVGDTPRAALASAWRLSNRIVAAGSIFLLGEVMKEIRGS